MGLINSTGFGQASRIFLAIVMGFTFFSDFDLSMGVIKTLSSDWRFWVVFWSSEEEDSVLIERFSIAMLPSRLRLFLGFCSLRECFTVRNSSSSLGCKIGGSSPWPVCVTPAMTWLVA